jgi:hypothetical protein
MESDPLREGDGWKDRVQTFQRRWHVGYRSRSFAFALALFPLAYVLCVTAAFATNFKDDLAKHAETHFTAHELSTIRKGEQLTDAIVGKIIDGISHFAEKFYEMHPGWGKPPTSTEMPYPFVFRYALCAYLHALHWIAVGGGKDRKDEKLTHDFVDVALVAYATCFDGLLTKDKVAMEIYNNARHLLDQGFLREDVVPKSIR